ncbi:hypothetical protein CTZ24_25645 (plasmid) [Pantoea phytobeneficialis]|uniref:Uncharacterized protein n=1 Tax=Pantoea phytobeneficialis TaxID=2052056 RepID=A0AAP9KSH7_9GAMM|nr:hypothetical protein CTZ24_25645 [Pantoea phytobeneficialis]
MLKSIPTYSRYSQGRSNNLILIRSYIDPIKAKTIPGSLQALVSLGYVKVWVISHMQKVSACMQKVSGHMQRVICQVHFDFRLYAGKVIGHMRWQI